MKIGYNEATAMKKSNLALDLKYCEKYCYDYIEIRLDMLQDYLKTHTINDLKDFFKTSHLKPFSFNSIEDINFCTEEEWKDRMSLFTFACEMSKALNVPYIVVVPTMGDNMKDYTEAQVFEDSVKVLRELSDVARPYGVKLGFEPIDDERWCVRTVRQTWDIVKEVDRDNVGVVIDVFNLYMNDGFKHMDDINDIPLEKLYIFHIDDAEDIPLEKIDQPDRLFPGEGVAPVKEVVTILKNKGYDEIASIELFRPEYWEWHPEDTIRIGYKKTKALLESV